MKYFIAIDFGLKHFGLAVADRETRIAFALDQYETSKLIEELRQTFKEYPPFLVILGRHLISEKSGLSRNGEDIRKLAEKIEKEFSIPVEFAEEIFSTKLAQENIASKRGRKVFSGNDDAEAARLILEGWLDKKNT